MIKQIDLKNIPEVRKTEIKKSIFDNMHNEIKHLEWFFGVKPKAFSRTIDNMIEEISILRKLYKS